MSPTPILLRSPEQARSLELVHDGQPDPAKTCRFAGSCSCVFQKAEPTAELIAATDRQSDSVKAEVLRWQRRAYNITSADARSITLTKSNTVPFCVNLALCVLTAFVWVAVWAVRAHRVQPVKTVVLTIDADGEFVAATPSVA